MLDIDEVEAMLPRAEAAFEPEDYEFLRAVVDSYKYIAELAGRPGMTMGRLRELCFGSDAQQPKA